MQSNWQLHHNTCLAYFEKGSITKQSSIILMDIDDTLIKRNTGLLLYKEHTKNTIIQKMKEGFTFVLVSNQKRVNPDTVVQKIESIYQQLGFRLNAFAALDDDIFRKPRTGILEIIKELSLSNVLNFTLFVGDAAGRVGDFANTDLKFALNANIKFQTPEQFFDINKDSYKNN
jgi:bifunctional polynucleotide phosphatase/kinase